MPDSKTTQHNFTGAEIDTLRKLCRVYPAGVDAGDIPSKAGRSDLDHLMILVAAMLICLGIELVLLATGQRERAIGLAIGALIVCLACVFGHP